MAQHRESNDNMDLYEALEASEPTLYKGGRKERFPILKAFFRSFYVSILCTLLVCASAGQAVGFKRLGYPMGDYPYFILLVISFAFVPIFFSVVAFVIWRTGGFLPETNTWEFKLRFLVVGMFNAFNGICTVFSNPHVPGSLQQILIQMVVPCAMILSYFFLEARYSTIQIVGSFIIFSGAFLKMCPTGSDHLNGNEVNLLWVWVFVVGQLPMAAQSVYQEYAFSQARVNVVHMMAWASLGQFLVLCLCAPINLIPYFGNLSLSDFKTYFQNASLCLANNLEGHEECGDAIGLMSVCVVAMLMSNVLQASLVKADSASLVVVILTLVTPISTIAFTSHFLMGTHAEVLHWTTWIALLIISIGIVIFRWEDLKSFIITHKLMAFKPSSEATPLLAGNGRLGRRTLSTDTDHRKAPRMLSTRVGIISSEYTHGELNPEVGLLYENTQTGY